ncbi:hypothetical protein KBD20_00580 [Candidatus Saccharibacteria bacterium]|nr:hypothetical protein [Candidatus Saccharibacteria bacterium]
MLDHHIQRAVVYHLALEDNLRFSELKPAEIESKLFTYHLKKVVSAGYVTKNEDGRYSLTAEGRRLGIRVLSDFQTLSNRAHSVLFLVIRRKADGAWLLYRRKIQPLVNRVGFMHCTPNSQEPVLETANKLCKERTGLSCEFSALGNGYFRMLSGETLESFTHFTLLVCENAIGDLIQGNEYSEYYWQTEPDFTDSVMLPNMQALVEKYLAGEQFFLDQTVQV